MANVNTIKTRILNKYDLLTNYQNFTPLKGEVCIAVIGEETTTNKGLKGDTSKKPIVGIKVGDGTNSFNNLPWIQAVAGDVSTFVKGIVDEAKFNELVNALIANAKLATKDALDGVDKRLQSAEGKITGLEAVVLTGDNSNDKLRAAITAALTQAKGYTDTRETAILSAAAETAQGKVDALANGTVKKHTDDIAGINTKIGEVAYTGASLTAAIKNLQDSIGSSDSISSQVADLSGRVGTLEGAIGNASSGLVKDVADLKTAITDSGSLGFRVKTLEGEMDTVQATIAGYNGTNTIAKDIKSAKDSASAANTLAGQNKTKVDTLIGSDSDKSVRDIAALVISEALVDGGEDFNTLQEIAAWIKDHPADATAMNNAISAIKTNLGWTGETAPATVDSRIATAISNLETSINIINYATKAELKTTNDNVVSLQNKVDTGEQNISAYVEAAKQAAISAAATDATTKAGTAKSEAIAAAATDATTKASAAQEAAEAKVAALAGEGNTATVKGNADAIAGLKNRIDDLDYSDSIDGVVATVSQTDGKINVTHKKVGVADLADEVFVFYCGNATGYAEDMKTVTI